jgi:hypothetical protein
MLDGRLEHPPSRGKIADLLCRRSLPVAGARQILQWRRRCTTSWPPSSAAAAATIHNPFTRRGHQGWVHRLHGFTFFSLLVAYIRHPSPLTPARCSTKCCAATSCPGPDSTFLGALAVRRHASQHGSRKLGPPGLIHAGGSVWWVRSCQGQCGRCTCARLCRRRHVR